MSEKKPLSKEKTLEIQERTRERNLIIQQIKNQGPSTVDELSQSTSLEKSKLLKHLIAMQQFGKLRVISERNDQLVYDLPEEQKK